MRKILLLSAAFVLAGSLAFGGAVLTTGLINMGVGDNAGLGFSGVGLDLIGGPGDAITPGCLCEGWGAAASGASGYVYGLGSTSITSSAFVAGATPDAAVVTSVLANGLEVVHSYSSDASGYLFGIENTITNTTAAALTDVRYARTLDWDVPPGHFGEDYLTIFVPGGAPAGKVLHTSSNPFAVPDPMVTRAQDSNTNVADLFGGDKGAYIILTFGDLDPGASVTFKTFIGAAPTRTALMAAFAAASIEAYTHSSDDSAQFGATYGWGFQGVGLPPVGDVPEPSTYALMGAGLGMLFALARRKKA